MTPLNRSYSVKIGEQPSGAEAAVKMALTPVTVAADGALMIASLVLLPFIVVLVAHDMRRTK